VNKIEMNKQYKYRNGKLARVLCVDAEIGQKIVAKNARDKIWALEGYVLRNKLAGL
jgi:Phage protein (N4 Gp49/phage Sf6 gene 66) family